MAGASKTVAGRLARITTGCSSLDEFTSAFRDLCTPTLELGRLDSIGRILLREINAGAEAAAAIRLAIGDSDESFDVSTTVETTSLAALKATKAAEASASIAPDSAVSPALTACEVCLLKADNEEAFTHTGVGSSVGTDVDSQPGVREATLVADEQGASSPSEPERSSDDDCAEPSEATLELRFAPSKSKPGPGVLSKLIDSEVEEATPQRSLPRVPSIVAPAAVTVDAAETKAPRIVTPMVPTPLPEPVPGLSLDGSPPSNNGGGGVPGSHGISDAIAETVVEPSDSASLPLPDTAGAETNVAADVPRVSPLPVGTGRSQPPGPAMVSRTMAGMFGGLWVATVVIPKPIDASVLVDAGAAVPDAPASDSDGACEVILDIKPAGATVIAAGVPIAAGARRASVACGKTLISIEHEQYANGQVQIEARKGSPASLVHRLKQEMVMLRVQSTPRKAWVQIAGEGVGKTPVRRRVPAFEPVTLRVSRAGSGHHSQVLTPTKDTVLDLRLRRWGKKKRRRGRKRQTS
ncbi:MAG: hypothetical protein GY811_05735 [Myxococcales bacterium]|nr:hypothetical protein [Myxococcales bacterium]